MSSTDTLRAFDRLLADAAENLANGQTPGQYVELFTSTYADIPAFTAEELAEFLALALVRLAQIADVGGRDLTPHGRGELIGRTLRGEPMDGPPLPQLELELPPADDPRYYMWASPRASRGPFVGGELSVHGAEELP